ncbi:MAG: glycosyltransferase [Acidobacteriota bacterium]
MDTRQNAAPASRPGISLILPGFNEQDSIAEAIGEAHAALSRLTDRFEILVVNDGSTDATAARARQAASRLGNVRVLSHASNQGYGAALRTGFDAATFELVGFTDADCQFDVSELDGLVLLCSRHDIACGYRIARQDPTRRRFYARVYNQLARTLLGTGVRDCDCALKLFHRRALQRLAPSSPGFFINAEMLTKARLQGLSVAEIGVTHRPRRAGSSKVSLGHAFPVVAELLRFWWTSVLFPQIGRAHPAAATARRRRRSLLPEAIVVGIAAILLFSHLGYPLIDPDETRNAQIAREMLDSGDLVVPTLHGQPYLDKPPLLYWLTAASYRLAGPGEASARLPSALAAFLTLLVVYGLGRRLVGRRAAGLGAVVLLTCVGFAAAGRFLIMDALLTLFTTTLLLASCLALGKNRVRWRWWLLAAIACGLGILVKGPVIAILCLVPLAAHLWLTRDRTGPALHHWAIFAGVSGAVCVPWFVMVSSRQEEFLHHFFWQHNIQRFVSGFVHQEPWWFYAPALVLMMAPGAVLLPAVGLFLGSKTAAVRRARTREMGYLLLAAAWIIGFFSLSASKLPTYILPALPPLCLATGVVLSHIVHRETMSSRLADTVRRLPGLASLAILPVVIIAGFVDRILDRQAPFDTHLLDGSVLAVTVLLLIAVLAGRIRRHSPAWTVTATASLVLSAVLLLDVFPDIAFLRSLPAQALQIRDSDHDPATPVVALGTPTDAGLFFIRHDAVRDFTPAQIDELTDLVARHPSTVLITDRRYLPELREHLGGSHSLIEIGGRGHIFLAHLPSPSGTISHSIFSR